MKQHAACEKHLESPINNLIEKLAFRVPIGP